MTTPLYANLQVYGAGMQRINFGKRLTPYLNKKKREKRKETEFTASVLQSVLTQLKKSTIQPFVRSSLPAIEKTHLWLSSHSFHLCSATLCSFLTQTRVWVRNEPRAPRIEVPNSSFFRHSPLHSPDSTSKKCTV